MNTLDILIQRLKKIGIEIELAGNFPFIYLSKVNANWIQEEDYYLSSHGFIIAFIPISEFEKIEIFNIRKTFEIIRKYDTKRKSKRVI